MKTENFQKKDGTKGQKHTLEPGDRVTARFDSPKKSTVGKYENWSLGINDKKLGDTFVQLTKSQAQKLLEIGKIQGRTLEAYAYNNQYGEQVGVKVL